MTQKADRERDDCVFESENTRRTALHLYSVELPVAHRVSNRYKDLESDIDIILYCVVWSRVFGYNEVREQSEREIFLR